MIRRTHATIHSTEWSRVGVHGVAIGRFVIDRETDDVSSFSLRLAPYVSSRFTMMDSVQPPMQRTRARLEGALGYELGWFGLGLSAGIESVACQVAWARAVADWITVADTIGGRKAIVTLRSELAAPRSATPPQLQPMGNRSVCSLAVGVRPYWAWLIELRASANGRVRDSSSPPSKACGDWLSL